MVGLPVGNFPHVRIAGLHFPAKQNVSGPSRTFRVYDAFTGKDRDQRRVTRFKPWGPAIYP